MVHYFYVSLFLFFVLNDVIEIVVAPSKVSELACPLKNLLPGELEKLINAHGLAWLRVFYKSGYASRTQASFQESRDEPVARRYPIWP